MLWNDRWLDHGSEKLTALYQCVVISRCSWVASCLNWSILFSNNWFSSCDRASSCRIWSSSAAEQCFSDAVLYSSITLAALSRDSSNFRTRVRNCSFSSKMSKFSFSICYIFFPYFTFHCFNFFLIGCIFLAYFLQFLSKNYYICSWISKKYFSQSLAFLLKTLNF